MLERLLSYFLRFLLRQFLEITVLAFNEILKSVNIEISRN